MAKIGIIDSGAGALSILPYLFQTGHKVTCLIDDLNAPFGNKMHADLIGICSKNVNFLFESGADVVVIMCNTLSSVCREVWHDKSSVIAVEPALNLLSRKTGVRRALICTSVTATSSFVKKFKGNFEFNVIPLTSLAGIIDALIPDEDRILDYVTNSMRFLKNYDEVVLGCTHYSLIKGIFCKAFPSVKFIDGTNGVFSRLITLYGTAPGEKFELNVRTTSGGGLTKIYDTIKKLKKFSDGY